MLKTEEPGGELVPAEQSTASVGNVKISIITRHDDPDSTEDRGNSGARRPKKGAKRGRKPLWIFYPIDENSTVDREVRRLRNQLWLDVARLRIQARPEAKARFPGLLPPGREKDLSYSIQEQAVRAYVLSRRFYGRLSVSAALRDMQKGRARVEPAARLREFGKWLLIDGAPGLKARQGPRPDLQTVFQTVAVLYVATTLVYPKLPTAREAALVWRVLYDQQVRPDVLKGRMKTAGAVCGDFLHAVEQPDLMMYTTVLVFNNDPIWVGTLSVTARLRPPCVAADDVRVAWR